MRGDNCCHRCRAVPGACGLQRDCVCHQTTENTYARRDWVALEADRQARAAERLAAKRGALA